jgi:hypothetical protein
MFGLVAASLLGLSSPTSIRRHALELRDKGFTVVDVDEAGLDGTLVADAAVASASELSRLLLGVERMGLNPDEDVFAFREIATRHRKRYGFQPQTPSAWTRYVEAAVDSVATPVIEAMHGLPPHPEDMPEQAPQLTGWARHLLPSRPVIEHMDCIVSRTGAKAQGFHPDAGDTHIKLARLNARHRLYNVFCPLKNLEEGGDGTMFWPGSHHRWGSEAFAAAMARSGRLENDAAAMAEMVVPACKAGGMRERADTRPSMKSQPRTAISLSRARMHARSKTHFILIAVSPSSTPQA